MTRAWMAGMLLATLGGTASAGVADDAQAVLRRHCVRCHGGQVGADAGGFDYVLRRDRLVAEELVVPGRPATSRLLVRVRRKEMPPRKIKARPTAAEIRILERWIQAGAPAIDQAVQKRKRLGLAGVEALARADLAGFPPREQRWLRYFSAANLWDAGHGDAELAELGSALRKLLNSLSWKRVQVKRMIVGDQRVLYRVDLRQLGWHRSTWRHLASQDPYALVRRTTDARYLRQHTRTAVPVVRADWFVAAASRPPLYHRVLEVPPTLEALGRKLGVDLSRNRRRLRVARAGFSGSGVSSHNRVIERHTGPYGYVWVSYDFKNSTGRRNIFERPTDFAADGHEVIFALPNGMQGYMIANSAGRRIAKAPTSIVVDPARADRAVENGLSCMGCHKQGIIPKRDQIRAHVRRNARTLTLLDPGIVGQALAIYPPASEMDRHMAADRERYLRAAGPTGPHEPINRVARGFEAPVDAEHAAAELGITKKALRRMLARYGSVRVELGALSGGGSVKRDAFATAFGRAALLAGSGEVAQKISGERLDELRCDVGFGRSCFWAGKSLLARGDFTRARQRFDRACRGRHPESCRQVANFYYRGTGVRLDRGLASRYYSRACRLGSGLACSNLAFLYMHGRGVAVSRSLALRFYTRACRNHRAQACHAAGTMAYAGGNGVARDRRRAARLFDRACRGGIAPACHQLAVQYQWGKGVTINWWRARKKFQRACNLGHRDSCWLAGDLFEALR